MPQSLAEDSSPEESSSGDSYVAPLIENEEVGLHSAHPGSESNERL